MNKRSGFTLIELLVVIAIIAVLMSVLMPSLQRVRNQAKGVMCQTHLKQWGLVWTMYMEDNLGKFTDYEGHDWMEKLRLYYADNDALLFCPMTNRNKISPALDQMRYAVITRNNIPVSSYSVNEWVYESDDTSGGRKRADYWRNTQHRGLPNIPVMGDGVGRSDGQPNHTDSPPEFEGQSRTSVNVDEIRFFTIPRHRNGVNVLFMDWSIRHVGIKSLWRLKWHKSFDTNYPAPVWPKWMSGFSDD